jgi:hypothetical protein
MKLRFKYLAIAAIGVGSGLIMGGNAFAETILQSQVTQLIQKQVLSYLPKELAGLIDPSGNINVDRTLSTLSKQGAEMAIEQMSKKGSATKTAGQELDALIKDEVEVAQTANSKAQQDSLDDFRANAPIVDRTIADNSTASESSLEAADKANNINGAMVASNQRQINSTNNLTTAVQISNTNAIRQAQQDRAKQIRERMDIAANREDIAHTRAVLLNRYYADGTGTLTKVTDNSGLAAFGGN